MLDGGLAAVLRDEAFFDRGQHVHPLLEAILLERRGRIAHVAVVVDHERRVRHAQEAGPHAAAADRDERRNLQVAQLAGQLVADHRTIAGMLDRGIGNVAGVHVVTAAGVIRFARAHRADDGHVLHLLGHHAACARRSACRRWWRSA